MIKRHKIRHKHKQQIHAVTFRADEQHLRSIQKQHNTFALQPELKFREKNKLLPLETA